MDKRDKLTDSLAHVEPTALKKLLVARGMKPKELITKTGWSKSTVYEMLAGTKSPDAEQAKVLGEIFGVPAETFLKGV